MCDICDMRDMRDMCHVLFLLVGKWNRKLK